MPELVIVGILVAGCIVAGVWVIAKEHWRKPKGAVFTVRAATVKTPPAVRRARAAQRKATTARRRGGH